MADIIIDTDDTDGFVFSTADSTLTLNAGVTLSNTGVVLDASALADGRSITVKGTVSETAGTGVRGVAIDIDGALSSVVISATGRIESEKAGIKMSGDNSSIDIIGTVISGTTGVTMSGDDAILTVSGTLQSSATAIFMGEGFGEQIVINTGLIEGVNIGFSLQGEAKLLNQKSGVITGPNNFGGEGTQEIINKGVINGDIFLGDGFDLFDGRGGTLNGRVFGGDDSDRYIVNDIKTEIIEESDEGEHDTVEASVTFSLGDNVDDLTLKGKKNLNGFGNELGNSLDGNSGKNRLEGGDGDDRLEGGDGADFIKGGSGVDRVAYFSATAAVTVNLASGKGKRGDAEGDRFSGIENISGSDFSDRLTGNNGDNLIEGRRGNDILTGGNGIDRFLFDRGTGHDVITDFLDGKDILDMQRFGDDLDGGFDDIKDFITQKNGDTIINLNIFSQGVSVRLEDTKAAELDASDFIF